jgi:hypothetical protein
MATWLNFVSYEDIVGPIDMDIHTRVVCQIDSLHRLKNMVDYDTEERSSLLIIYDEFCSILSHINSKSDRSEQK